MLFVIDVCDFSNFNTTTKISYIDFNLQFDVKLEKWNISYIGKKMLLCPFK